MNNKLLYFPYINIPNTSWTAKSILYWDKVGAIVPDIYKDNPNRFENNMLDLVQTGLIEQVSPYQYIHRINNFDDLFYQLTQSPTFDIDERQINFRSGFTNRLHIQKFGDSLLNELIRMGIASRESWEWYHVEAKTARLFMMYLATIISQMDNYTPATDKTRNIDLSIQQNLPSYLKQRIRGQFLNDLLPYPIEMDIPKLVRFKEKYYTELNSFRTLLEQKIILIQNINRSDDRNSLYQLSLQEIMQKKDFLYSKMNESKIGKIVFGTLFGLTVAGINLATGNSLGIFEFGNAVFSALDGYNNNIKTSDFAYLALIDKNFRLR